MKIEGLKEKLLSGISVAEKTTGKNLTLPILSCLYLDASEKGVLKIRATNIDLGIEVKIAVKTEITGSVVVPGNILQNVISSMYDSNNITLELQDMNLIVSTPRSRTVIKALPTDDFPTLPEIEDTDVSFTISTIDFLKGMQTVWYSASNSSIKQELASVYIYTYDKKLYFVATDSFRLAEKKFTTRDQSEFEPILIPIKNIQEIIKVFEYIGDEDVKVHLNKNQIAFVSKNVYVTSRLIDGIFPDYKQILPKEFSTEVILLKQDLVNILKKISIFSDKSNQIRFVVKPSKKTVYVSSQNKDIGETKETIEAAITGEDLEINFNYKYISDCLQSVNSDSVSLSFTGLSKPMVIKGVSDASFLYLVMPMNK